ncbi:hypothetical protein ACFY21_13755 [Micromonospora sp. NPDC000212]|uniref:hypothetical protein n=1 Tax=Micromonospora sp. NPDC000212 TaxID=3364215 RepID=UPI00368EF895
MATARPRPAAPGCGGKLALGTVASCASISGARQHAFTVTSQVAQDILLVRLREVSGDPVSGRVTGPTGESVCILGPYLDECRLGAAGSYRVTVSLTYSTGEAAYTLSAESTRTPSTCETLPAEFFSFASPGRAGTLPAGLASRCFTFTQAPGEVLQVSEPGGRGEVRGVIRDATNQPLCTVDYVERCELNGPGPYRLFLGEMYGAESAYTLKMPRLSHQVGCPALPLARFGDPGPAVAAGSLPTDTAVACHALTAAAAGPVVVRVDAFADQFLSWAVYDAAGALICEEWSHAHSCTLPAAGSYTLLARSDRWEPLPYQVAVVSLGTAGCAAATGTNWDQPALLVHQTSAVQTNCQPFRGEGGDRVQAYHAPTAYNSPYAWIVDEGGNEVCTEPSEEDGCVLPSTGTFRVVSYLAFWNADDVDLTYRMQVRRLSQPVGCPTVAPGAYDAPPAGALGGIRCRSLDIGTAGTYRVRAAGAENDRRYATVYDSTGHRLCTDEVCRFPAAGRYPLVLDGGTASTVIDLDVTYTVALLPLVPKDCPTVSDSGLQDPPHRGRFTAAGQFNCLKLASPAGARIVELLPGEAVGAAAPRVSVVDASGTQVCDSSWSLREYRCELTGQAPFFAVLDAAGGSPVGAYSLAFARVDGPPACPVLPAGDTGATATTGADRFAVCFSIPADQRAAQESITWQRTSGIGDARLSVFDAEGNRYCGPTAYAVQRTVTCTLPAGPVTVLLEADGVDATYQLTHRPATAPAA